jgi:hypothetical protein
MDLRKSRMRATAAVWLAGVPSLINYQGKLLDGTNLVNGQVALAISLYNGPGDRVYEDSGTVAVVDGVYSRLLGDHTTFGDLVAALTNEQVWLEVEVNGVTLSPRERVGSAPYAIRANESDPVWAAASGNYVQKTGDTMSGPLVLESADGARPLLILTQSNSFATNASWYINYVNGGSAMPMNAVFWLSYNTYMTNRPDDGHGLQAGVIDESKPNVFMGFEPMGVYTNPAATGLEWYVWGGAPNGGSQAGSRNILYAWGDYSTGYWGLGNRSFFGPHVPVVINAEGGWPQPREDVPWLDVYSNAAFRRNIVVGEPLSTEYGEAGNVALQNYLPYGQTPDEGEIAGSIVWRYSSDDGFITTAQIRAWSPTSAVDVGMLDIRTMYGLTWSPAVLADWLGRVTIGATNLPEQRLDVHGNAIVRGALYLDGSSNIWFRPTPGAGPWTNLWVVAEDTVITNAMIQRSAGFITNILWQTVTRKYLVRP